MAEQRSSSSGSSNGKKQRGGTFLSFVGGVVVGLGVALAVAVYVSNVPIPFLNKNQPRNAEQDAAEVRKNKDWDPNAALYGKNPAPRPAAAVPAPAVTTAPALEPALPTTPPPPLDDGAAPDPAPARPARATANATAATRAAAVPAPAVERPAPVAAVARTAPPAAASDDPLGDLAAKRAQPRTVAPVATAAATTTADPYNYLVQAGAYNSMNDAEAQRARLSILGIESKITERDQSGRTIYRVRVGPFDSKDSADRVKERLDSSGNVSTLLRVQR